MNGWNTDIKAAPHGRYEIKQRREGVDTRVFVAERVILATKCGKVTLSHYIPQEKRWLMLGKNEQPDAWMPWPEHPNSARGPSNPAGQAGETCLLPVSPAANSHSLSPQPSQTADSAGAGATAPAGQSIVMKHEGIRT